MGDRITRIEFRVDRDRGSPSRRWVPIGDPEGRPVAMLDDWLASSELSCCSFQGGFFVDVNGATWSDHYTVDEFRMTMIWFKAMDALLGGAASFGPSYGP